MGHKGIRMGKTASKAVEQVFTLYIYIAFMSNKSTMNISKYHN